MSERADRLLARWCTEGDVEALSGLFDLTAGRLLQLAIHLVGDGAEAEDLVQATFLVVIQRRETLDPGRPALPWLTGVLGKKAADVRRKAARRIDPARLSERLTADPSQPAEERELSGLVAEAIDRLEEPYRQVLLLRVRHGMASADIAHVLERSPGTVRVQLHRALEKLRELLPAGICATLGATVLPVPARGLEVVRSAVVTAARRSLAPEASLTASTWIGAAAMNHKLVLAGITALALLALALFGPGLSGPPAADVGEQGAPRALTTAQAPAVTPTAAPVTTDTRATIDEPAAAARAAVPTRVLSGTVLDGETGAPLAGVRVATHAPRRSSQFDALRDHPELYEVNTHGRIRARTWADWPSVGDVTASQRFGVRELTLLDVVPPDAQPLSETVTDADGTFELAVAEAGALVACEKPGYGRRLRPAREEGGDELTITMLRERTLSGRVVYPPEQPPAEPLTIVLTAMRAAPSEAPEDGSFVEIPDHANEGLGAWTVTTNEDGTFEVQVAAEQVMAEVLDEGWRVNGRGLYDTGAPANILVLAVPAFHFFDAATNEPVERVHVLGRETNNGYVRWSGEFFAKGGLLTMPGGGGMMQWHSKDTLAFTCWADGYAARTVTLSGIRDARRIEVPLERGSVEVLRGAVTRGGTGAEDVEVALLGHSPLQWREDEDTLVEATLTGEAGHFEMEVPEGDYVLRVQAPGVRYFELLHVPHPGPFAVDLERTGRIEVVVTDTDGLRRAEHTVVLSGEDGRGVWSETDADGVCAFGDLSPATFSVMVPNRPTRSSFSADRTERVELAVGEHRRVEVVVPGDRPPAFARVEAGDVRDYTGWRARCGGEEWEPLGVDGRVPFELSTVVYVLVISAPDERRWSVRFPKDAEDGHVIRLAAGDASYRGVLLRADGAPLAGHRLFATPQDRSEDGDERVTASCVSGADGGFVLRGLLPAPYRIEVRADPSHPRNYDYNCPFRGVTFRPDEPPGDDVWIEVRMPRRPGTVRVHGEVRDSSGAPRAGLVVFFDGFTRTANGELRLRGENSSVRTDADGAFEILLPRTERKVLRIFEPRSGNPALLTHEFRDVRGEEQPALELVLDE